MTRKEAIERFNGIINAMSISIAQSKFYPSKAELDELCDIAIEALSEKNIARDIATILENEQDMRVMLNASTEAVQVVRCKDCKYSHMTYDGRCKYCDKWEDDGDALYLGSDFYCAYGERKGGDDE